MATQASLERAERFGHAWDLPGKIRRELAAEFDAAGNEALEKAAKFVETSLHYTGKDWPHVRAQFAAAIRAMKKAQS